MSKLLSNLRHDTSSIRPYIDGLFCYQLPKIIAVVPNRTKYYNNRVVHPKYRNERRKKMWRIDIPDFDYMRKEKDTDVTPDQVRSKLKEKGIAPPNPWNEREVYSPSTIDIMDPYKPPQGDWKSSSLLDKAKTPLTSGKALIKSRRELSAIKTFEGEDFDLKEFAKQSTEIYVKAHEALASKDEDKVFDYVTEHCFPIMTAGINRHTINWKYLGDVEPPEVVQVRTGDMMSKGNKYSQITVRMHTKQLLAVYDRHGRLINGSPTDVKEVLEFIVFEKYLANEYGSWRIHARIRPEEEANNRLNLVSKTYAGAAS